MLPPKRLLDWASLSTDGFRISWCCTSGKQKKVRICLLKRWETLCCVARKHADLRNGRKSDGLLHIFLFSIIDVNMEIPFSYGLNGILLLLFIQIIFFAEEDDSALKKSELINWYLKEIESEIESEEELINKKKIIERVIHRLTHYVCIDVWIVKKLF